jgi:hypothetical protein
MRSPELVSVSFLPLFSDVLNLAHRCFALCVMLCAIWAQEIYVASRRVVILSIKIATKKRKNGNKLFPILFPKFSFSVCGLHISNSTNFHTSGGSFFIPSLSFLGCKGHSLPPPKVLISQQFTNEERDF